MRRTLVFTISALLLAMHVVTGTNFNDCLARLKEGANGTGIDAGGTDNAGNRVVAAKATGITYKACVQICGAGQEPFNWSIFSQQFSAWLLPWLALISQLPFGANDRVANLESALLTLGSPVLAAYSVALTVLNGRWIAARFNHNPHPWPSRRNIVKALSSLQQVPLIISDEAGRLSSLIILEKNDKYWKELVDHLHYTHTWSISAVTSIIWVVIAYVFTVADSFTGDILMTVNSNGQAVGDLWLWLLPVVTGWLQISPKCDWEKVKRGIQKSNEFAYAAVPDREPVEVSKLGSDYGLSLDFGSRNLMLHKDKQCSVPIYNYARLFQWVEQVEEIAHILDSACKHASNRHPVNGDQEWTDTHGVGAIDPRNRTGTLAQVQKYKRYGGYELPSGKWSFSVVNRVMMASVMALLLQWGTTGAAIVAIWYTPTTGLGCRSASYILYGVLSTISWFLLLLSSILAHYIDNGRAVVLEEKYRQPPPSASAIRRLAILLRITGKFIAYCNSIWVILICMFQFGNFFDRCYCNSSVFGNGRHAYNAIQLSRDDVNGLKKIWIGGVSMAGVTAGLFVFFVGLLINPDLPGSE